MNVGVSVAEAPEAPLGSASGPPPVPFVLAVGVTGHRADMLPDDSIPLLRERIRDVLQRIEEAGRDLLAAERSCFAPFEPRLRFVSPLADGADQIAAEVALELGWELQAVLPFERADYRASLASEAARERFDALIARADLRARASRRSATVSSMPM